MNVIETQAVSRRYVAGTLALDKVTLAVPQGCVYGLLGRNGSGKSTLIRLLMALLHPTDGKVQIFGQDPWSDHAGIKSRIGYISEDQTLPAYLKVSDMFAFFAECFKNWDQDLAEKLRAKFKLDADKKLHQFSKGQQRQVGIICAVAHHPELLILDEPGGGLDAVARRELLEMIIELLHSKGTTVFFSSHHLHDVERIANQIGILHEGKLLLESSLDDLHENYCKIMLPLDTADLEATLNNLAECISVKRGVSAYTAVFSVNLATAEALISQHLNDPENFQGSMLNLEEAFVALAGDTK